MGNALSRLDLRSFLLIGRVPPNGRALGGAPFGSLNMAVLALTVKMRKIAN
jgi:hypothetical protein